VQAEYTLTTLAPDLFYLISTPRAERWNCDDLSKALPRDGGVKLRNVTEERGCFTVVGPRARDLLQPLTDTDLGNAAFPWLSAKIGEIGLARDVRMLRVNYEGELGWELYHPISYQRHLLTELLRVGEPMGLKLVGLQALESLRLDKSYRAMYRDMNAELTAWDSGLEKFVQLDKGDFIGRDALVEQRRTGVPRRVTTLAVEAGDASVWMHEGVYRDGKLVGRVTSGGYSYTLKHDIALALLPPDLTASGTQLEIPVLGQRRAARVIADSPYDPDNLRLRA
jgi:dimethylglycine dehydrogenase